MPAAPTIDTHAHYFPQSYLDLIAKKGPRVGARVEQDPKGNTFIQVGLSLRTGPIEPLFTDLDGRLKEMDRQGVKVHILSLTQPMVYWADDELGLELSMAFNDAISAAHKAHPERLYGFATLPLQNAKLALEELDRVARLPGIRGIYAATVVRDRDLSDRSFFPLYARMEELGLPLFLHPMMVNNERMKQWYLINTCGNPFETALAASHLIFGGVLDAFPKLEISLPHAGGALPILRGRLDRGYEIRPECKHLPRRPSEYLKRFTYDTIAYDAKVLQDLVDLVGADRIMMGSDYCFDIAYEEPVKIVTGMETLSAAEKELILGGNAVRLLKLTQSTR
ncbi:MAG TPA: amidohydrolase family protein [Burkholderiales bacterium]|nr:amidohydrolase family protein [Burkholderiales bacterium]